MANSEKRDYEEWLQLCKRIKQKTSSCRPVKESPKERSKRIEGLLKDFSSFCKYYFPHYVQSDFGWFHLEAERKITADDKIMAVLEWPREHAKSVFADVLMPLWLKAKGQLTGMILVSSNQDKASGLLADIQAELENNTLYIEDFGEQASLGSWQDCYFVDKEGIGYWAFGRGQSPRGARVAEKRPNLAVVDDIDDKVLVKNEARVFEAVDWVKEDLLGCLAISGGRMIIVGNRIHKKSVLACLVGDIEDGDPVNPGISHIKVFAFEKAKHKKALWDDPKAVPAWPERHKAQDLKDRMLKLGLKGTLREYFHEHTEEGLVFKSDWIKFDKCPKVKDLEAIVVYCDPSFKNTATADYKAVIAVGKHKGIFYILKVWLRQDSVKSMVQAFYDMFELYGAKAAYYMEANMLQDLLLTEFDTAALEKGYHVPLRPDKAKKENKAMRIEGISPLFERGFVVLNEAERSGSDMQNLKIQLLGFGNSAVKDDGPDALEGAISKLNKRTTKGKGRVLRSGNYNHSNR